MKFCLVIGTRPEIIKVSPLMRYCEDNNLDYFIIHSNQHYSENMDKVFFEELHLPQPIYNLGIGSGTHGNQTGNILTKIEPILIDEKPDVVIVQGDTNTVLAAALAASKLNIKVAHVEAGLRSYNRMMPEETNRIVTDHISDYLFAPTQLQKDILLKEGIESHKIHVVGNTVVDAVLKNKALAHEKSTILNDLDIEQKEYILITAHRALNVDHKEHLEVLISSLNALSERFDFTFVYPIHPRTKKMVDTFDLQFNKQIKLIEPLGFLDFLHLETNARLIITDSGGIQEEACTLHVPCVTIRDDTERPETIDVGANVLSKTAFEALESSVKKMLQVTSEWQNPFGDGTAAEQIMEILDKT